MDNIFVWLLIFAGATIGLLSTFLIASERELKLKRQRVEELESKLADTPGPGSAANNSPDTNRVKELTARNQELLEEITALTHRLAASERRVDELQAIYARLSEVDMDNAELRSAGQRLQEENKELKTQLEASENHIKEWEAMRRETSDSRQLEAEIAALKRQLEESQAKLRGLEASEQQLANAASRESAWRDQQAELEAQIVTLRSEIAASAAKTNEMAALQSRLNEMERHYQALSEENGRFQQQISQWQERLAESEESRRRLEIIRRRLEELQARQSALAENSRQIQDQMLDIGGLLQAASGSMQQLDLPSSTQVVELPEYELRPKDSEPNPLWSPDSSIQAARDHIAAGRYQEALLQLESRLYVAPNDRETQLYHLLASVKLNGSDGYDKRISSIQDMPELTESERAAARDIFLVRAEEAQRRGRDDEMLRYRLWARSVIFRTPFGDTDNDTMLPDNGGDKANGQTSALRSRNQDVPSSMLTASSVAADELSVQASRKKKRFGLFVIVLLIFLLGAAMTAGFLRNEESDKSPAHATNVEGQRSPAMPKSAMITQNSMGNRPGDQRAEQKPSANTMVPTKSLTHATKLKNEKEASNTKQKPERSTPRAWGSYEIVRPVQVYSQPKERSELLANLDAGMKVNVVDSRNGWLEIRSKHGRPPGFIRTEGAVRIGDN